MNLQAVLKDKLRDELDHMASGELVHIAEGRQAEGVILADCSEQEGLQGGLLESVRQGLLERAIFELGESGNKSDVEDLLASTLPIRLVQGCGSKDDVVAVLLSSEMEGSLIVLVNKALKRPGHDLLSEHKLVLSEVGDLKQHRGDTEERVEDGHIDSHVEGDLSLGFLLLKLDGLIGVLGDLLGQQLLMLHMLADISKDLVGLNNFAHSEGSHTCLGKSPIIEDLVVDVLDTDYLAHVSLLEKVLSFSQPVVKGMMVDSAEGGTNSLTRCSILEDSSAEIFNGLTGVCKEVNTSGLVI